MTNIKSATRRTLQADSEVFLAWSLSLSKDKKTEASQPRHRRGENEQGGWCQVARSQK
ncbi:MAG: hypothetical protein UW94_C0016G0007 [Parcubacteria group bacterium GW2011_GWA2_45_14]|nr:MAG: hypothetical protein UW94_C0016G0007 [Parcubacteria group bacterium GW2011_GWA2_45_14]